MKVLIAVFSCLLLGQVVYAQDDVLVKWGQAQLALQSGRYYEAAELYEKVLKKEKENPDAWMEAGVAYYLMGVDKQATLSYFENALKYTKGDTIPELMYYLGQAYHVNYEFDKAISYLNLFKQTIGPKDDLNEDANLLISMCENGKRLSSEKKQWEILNMGKHINSEYPDFRPVLSLDRRLIFFTARRLWKDNKNKDMLTEDRGQYFEDIYYSYKGKGDKWEDAQKFTYNELERNEATVGVSASGQEVLIYMDDNKGDGNLYYSVFDNNNLKDVQLLPGKVNSKGWETHASFSPDGNTIYFTSDRKGGFGGRDIYKISKLPDGTWSDAQNLGSEINTKYDEESPFMASDGITLYFSSNSNKSMGGFDIFFSKLMKDGTITAPENMGYPLNTTDDDVFFVLGADGKTGYYSSNRQLMLKDKYLMESYGDLDIYQINFDRSYIEAAAILTGMILSPKGVPLSEGIEIEVTTAADLDNFSYYAPRKIDGGYVALLGPCDKYHIAFMKDGEMFYEYDQPTECKSGFQQFYKVLMLNEAKNEVKEVIPELQNTLRFKVMSSPQSLILADVVDLDPAIPSARNTVVNAENMFYLYQKTDNQLYKIELKGLSSEIAMNTCIAALDTAGNILGYLRYVNGSNFEADMNNLLTDCMKEYEKVDTTAADMDIAEQVSFKKNHGYNEYEIDLNASDWKDFVKGGAKLAQINGMVDITIESSASKVYTTTFVTNSRLARKRADEAQVQIIKALAKEGITEEMIRFVKVDALVQGPEYPNPGDYQNTNKYAPYQYVKASAK